MLGGSNTYTMRCGYTPVNNNFHAAVDLCLLLKHFFSGREYNAGYITT